MAHFPTPRSLRGDALPEPTLRRLPWYLAYVSLLRARGVDRVSSTAMSREMRVDAAKIAKDLSQLGVRGKTRVGYDVGQLERALADFLGFGLSHPAVMIGAGSLGRALMSDSGLSSYGLTVVEGFDVDPAVVGSSVAGRPVRHIDELPRRRPRLGADIAIIAVPVENAQDAADACVTAGIKALWNFTPRRLAVPDDVVVQNTSIYASLAVMYNRLQALQSQSQSQSQTPGQKGGTE